LANSCSDFRLARRRNQRRSAAGKSVQTNQYDSLSFHAENADRLLKKAVQKLFYLKSVAFCRPFQRHFKLKQKFDFYCIFTVFKNKNHLMRVLVSIEFYPPSQQEFLGDF
jgi:hypothetical protein